MIGINCPREIPVPLLPLEPIGEVATVVYRSRQLQHCLRQCYAYGNALSMHELCLTCTGADNEGLFNSAAHTAAARRSSRSSGQRSARLKQNAAVLKAASSGTTKAPKKKPATVVDKSYPLPDNFGQVVSLPSPMLGMIPSRICTPATGLVLTCY